MTTRDRIFLVVVVAAAMLAGVYFLEVRPERKQAATLGAQVAAAQAQVQSAQIKAAQAQAARSQYPDAYATIVRLGKAVPSTADEASLVYELDHLANVKRTELLQLDANTSATAAAPAAPAAAAASAVGAAAFTTKDYALAFTGSFFDLYHVLNSLNSFTIDHGNGHLDVSGRLVTIKSATLALKSPGQLSGAVNITAYYLPAAQGLTAGATSAAPGTGPSGFPSAQPASTSGGRSAAPASAVVKATP